MIDTETSPETVYDIAIIGGGINGCGIARDAAGRGLKVLLCEQGDLAQATSSASTKLFHGGLRYLEYYEFRLVREALRERETLLTAMPHIAWPLRFVLPHHGGLRPAWLIRLGLFLYDHLGGRKILPATKVLDLGSDPAGALLKPRFRKAFEYSDCWVDDARLVVLNARDAKNKGADILTRTRCTGGQQINSMWHLRLENTRTGEAQTIRAKAVVNAGGPWVDSILDKTLGYTSPARIRLVRGSHIVVHKLFDHNRAYIFQNTDGRIMFAIPYEDDFTLIGTTDNDHNGSPDNPRCSEAEIGYMLSAASDYLETPVDREQIVWTYSGVRPLYDDGASSATAATRDYVLHLSGETGDAPLLSIFGGKITTYRKLAQQALAKLSPWLPESGSAWTAGVPLPGGDFSLTERDDLIAALRDRFDFLDARWAQRLVRSYGLEAWALLDDIHDRDDLGRHFGDSLHEQEVRWLMVHEWAETAEDVLWRRSKLGLRFSDKDANALDRWMTDARQQTTAPQPEPGTGADKGSDTREAS